MLQSVRAEMRNVGRTLRTLYVNCEIAASFEELETAIFDVLVEDGTPPADAVRFAREKAQDMVAKLRLRQQINQLRWLIVILCGTNFGLVASLICLSLGWHL